jgi:hypothetical protein
MFVLLGGLSLFLDDVGLLLGDKPKETHDGRLQETGYGNENQCSGQTPHGEKEWLLCIGRKLKRQTSILNPQRSRSFDDLESTALCDSVVQKPSVLNHIASQR